MDVEQDLETLTGLIQTHGPHAQEVRDFINTREGNGEFEELAYIKVRIASALQEQNRKRRPPEDGLAGGGVLAPRPRPRL